MTPQEWAEKLYYDLSFAAPEMHLTHIVNRLAQAMDDAAEQERALADELADDLYLLWEGTHEYPLVAEHCSTCAALAKWEASR